MFVDLLNTVSRDNVSIQSTPVEDRYDIFHFEDVDNEVLQGTDSSCVTIVPLQTLALAEWVLLALESHLLKRSLSSP